MTYKIIKYIYTIGVPIVLSLFLFTTCSRLSDVQRDLDKSYTNIKAYSLDNDTLHKQKIVFQLTIDQLHTYNDSIFRKMVEVQNELKIKNKELSRIDYIEKETVKVDSIFIKDTIFNTNVDIDTIIQDKHYKLKLSLKYPGTIVVNPRFYSELYIITSDKRETIKPPKKFFLWRLFQKKHTVRVVDIYDESPYTIYKNKRFVEIIK